MVVKLLVLVALALLFSVQIETRSVSVSVEIDIPEHLTDEYWLARNHPRKSQLSNEQLQEQFDEYLDYINSDDSNAQTEAALNADDESIGFKKKKKGGNQQQQQQGNQQQQSTPTPPTDAATQQMNAVDQARKEAQAAQEQRIQEQQAEIEKHKQDLANANPYHNSLKDLSDEQLKTMLGILIKKEHVNYDAPPPDPLPDLSMDYRSHKTADDCWERINGEVYVLTNFVHSGDQSFITKNCGKDATTAYKNQHGDNAARLQKIARFKIRSLSTSQDCTDGTHSLPTDCWVQIKDEIYDLSSFLHPNPPGPEFVVRHCGGDGTADFMRQHGESYLPKIAQHRLTPEQIAAGSKNTCQKS